MKFQFTLNEKGKPPCYAPIINKVKKKVADCELLFDEGPLAGFKLQGFVIWERTTAEDDLPVGDLSVTPPGYQKPDKFHDTISLLRKVEDNSFSYVNLPRDSALRSEILDAFREWRQTARRS